MQPKIAGIAIVGLLIIVGGYFFLRSGYQAPTPAPTPEPASALQETETPTETPAPAQVPVSGVREINVIGTEFSFSPASVKIKAGEQVKIIFKNNGRAPHNLTVEELNLGTKTIGGGELDTIEFIAPSFGTYAFFCSVSGHRASGMEGSLNVE